MPIVDQNILRAGLDSLKKKLKGKMEGYQRGVETGIKKGAVIILAASMKEVPIDTGYLRRSAGIRIEGKGESTKAHIGYKAAYALWVHEMVGMTLAGQDRPAPHKGKYWDPQGRAKAKFLEDPWKANIKTVREIIHAEAIKGAQSTSE